MPSKCWAFCLCVLAVEKWQKDVENHPFLVEKGVCNRKFIAQIVRLNDLYSIAQIVRRYI